MLCSLFPLFVAAAAPPFNQWQRYQSKATWIHYLGTYGPHSSTVISSPHIILLEFWGDRILLLHERNDSWRSQTQQWSGTSFSYPTKIPIFTVLYYIPCCSSSSLLAPLPCPLSPEWGYTYSQLSGWCTKDWKENILQTTGQAHIMSNRTEKERIHGLLNTARPSSISWFFLTLHLPDLMFDCQILASIQSFLVFEQLTQASGPSGTCQDFCSLLDSDCC